MLSVNSLYCYTLALVMISGVVSAGTSSAELSSVLERLERMERRIVELESEVDSLRDENQQLRAAVAQPDAVPESQDPGLASARASNAEATVKSTETSADKAKPVDHYADARDDTQISSATLDKKPPVEGIDARQHDGFIPIFNRKAYIKFSAKTQVDLIMDSNNADSPGEFITSSLPVRGQSNYGSGFNSSISIRQSGISIEGLLETADEPIRFFYRNNFFGSSTSQFGYNLLEFYGEWNGLHLGYGYTAFLDRDAVPSTLDWEGPNSLPMVYNGQIRYTHALADFDGSQLLGKLSLEAGSPSITGVAAGNDFYERFPDGVAVLRLQGEDWHTQVSSVFSSLTAQTPSGNNADALGWGVAVSGSWNFTDDDLLIAWGNFGSGYANYVQDSFGLGLDAVLTPAGNLETIDAFGFGVGYTHDWSDNLSSTLSYGYLEIDDRDYPAIPPTTMNKTWYGSSNLVWNITRNWLLGAELLYGRKKAVNGATGDDFRVQVSTSYTFNP